MNRPYLNEEFFRQRFSERSANADDNQRDAEKHEADERIHRPEIKRNGKRNPKQSFHLNEKRTEKNGSAAENKEMSFADIMQKRDGCCRQKRGGNGNGKRKGQKPISARKQIDKPKIKCGGGKIARHENYGIRMMKPHR